MYHHHVPQSDIGANGYCCQSVRLSVRLSVQLSVDLGLILQTNRLEEMVYILAYWCIQMAHPLFTDVFGYCCLSVCPFRLRGWHLQIFISKHIFLPYHAEGHKRILSGHFFIPTSVCLSVRPSVRPFVRDIFKFLSISLQIIWKKCHQIWLAHLSW